MKSRAFTFRRHWAVPFLVLMASAMVVFWGFYTLDHHLTGGPPHERGGVLDSYVQFDPSSITDAVSSLAGLIAAVFGIVVTVVSIIVQLSADRYTGVARMFLRDRINLAVMAYYVIGCVYGVWLSLALQAGFVPRAALMIMLATTTFGLIVMGPYFGYVFWFLEPSNIIMRIRRDAVEQVDAGAKEQDPEKCSDAQEATLHAMEELTDITSNSISGKDKIIASAAVDALKDFALEYAGRKSEASESWFRIGEGIRSNPDFVAMDPESLVDLEDRKTWVEWKVMRQYLGIYNEALQPMRDINYLIAIDTRYIGEAAGEARDEQAMTLVLRYMNSYMRATLNAKEVRTAYNVLNQYRLLVEALLTQGNGAAAVAAVKHMNYYGHVSFEMKLAFVTETVAYDVSALCQHAHELGSPEEAEMLADFLELDRPLRVRSQEKALLGVRKAQVKLAAYYLASGEEKKARIICKDMEEEPKDRLFTIRQQLENVTSKDFWEIIDRGRNFEYMPPKQRKSMKTFFSWLGVDADSPPPESSESKA